MVCGRDFETTYGEIGKGFIHVHHLTPIASIGKEYRLNVDTDLAPVCPNCHYMLHRKNPPFTIEELKAKLQELSEPIKKRPSRKAAEIQMQAKAAMLRDVNDDAEVRKLIHNMMEMEGGTMMKNILSVCIAMFQQQYNNMKPNDWRHLIDDYVRYVTHRPDLQEDEVFYFKETG